MSDNEIVKALECCIGGKSCKDCPCYVDFNNANCGQALKGAIDLIGGQKAEIAKLKAENELLLDEVKMEVENRTKAKTEAVKEFAERLKQELFVCSGRYDTKYKRCIDNLLKEAEES